MPPQPTEPPQRVVGEVTARDPALDGLRGIAILLVYIFHYGGGLTSNNPAVRLFGYVTQAGWLGVDIFFALSGFLITRLFWGDRVSPGCLPKFYARRALRVLPLYFGALALAAIAALQYGAPVLTWRPLLIYAAFLQNVPPFLENALRSSPPLPLYHLWSLAVEEQFYLIWPLLLLACRTRRSAFRLCLVGFVLCCLFRNFVWSGAGPFLGTSPSAWSLTLPGRSGALALGGAVALVPRHWDTPMRRYAPLAVLFSLAGFLAAGFAEGGMLLNNRASVIFGLPCIEVLSAALVALTAAPTSVSALWRKLLSGRPLRNLGRISYGFYVFHILLEPWFDGLGRAATHTSRGMAYQLVRLLAAFPITVAVASLSYFCFEGPFLRLKRYFPHDTTELRRPPQPGPGV